jgi:hypothetical protein
VEPKILQLDIETYPAKVYVFGSRKQFISPEQVVDPDGVLCWSAKWTGKPAMKFGAKWDDPKFLEKLWKLIKEADAVVTFNGDGFDLPKIKGALVRAGLPPLPPVTSIDLYKGVKGLGFLSGKLAYVAPLLGLGTKLKHHGFGLWKDVLDGDEKARRLMTRYNKQDVRLQEELYHRLKPYLTKHPHLGARGACAACGSTHLTKQGYKHTTCFVIERLQCQSCGKWDEGKRTKK